MNGKPPPADGQVIAALTAFSYWLATGALLGQELPGRAYPEVPQPAGGFDLAKGKVIYTQQCAVCHGNEGDGQKAGNDYVFPPLWEKINSTVERGCIERSDKQTYELHSIMRIQYA